jgi:tRNA nucleotidyltransferase/poly(A) polymerase
MGRLSAERIKQEIEKTLDQVVRPSAAFRQWRDAGLFAAVASRFASATDAALATVDVIPLAPPAATDARKSLRRLQRLAALCASIDMSAALGQLRALRFSNADQAWVGRILKGVAAHSASLQRAAQGEMTAAQVERLARQVAHDVGRLDATEVVRLSAAGWSSATSRAGVRAVYRVVRASASRAAISVGDLAIDGEDLSRLGVHPGPMMGSTLRTLLDAVLDDPALNTRARLLALVESTLRAGGTHATS